MDRPKYWLYSLLKKERLKVYVSCIYILLCIALIVARAKGSNSEFDLKRTIYFYLAALWLLIGPIAINVFYKKYEEIGCLLESSNISGISLVVKNNYKINYEWGKIVSLFWEALLGGFLVFFPQTLKSFSIYGYTDPWYWMFLIGALFLLNLTACGLMGVVSGFVLLINIEKKTLIVLLWEKSRETVEKLCKFYCTTALCFSSGILFIPIIFDFVFANGLLMGSIVLFAVFIYLFLIVISYIMPVYILVKNIKKYKANKIAEIEKKYQMAINNEDHNAAIDYYYQMNYLEKKEEMPVNYKNIVQIVTVAIIPVIHFLKNYLSFFKEIIGMLFS
ncbi:MAG: hypothetical protein E7300_09310 [Lachnospiraceae bacterium]|nr:hypothetical protein [Lachnospiraceae bacterium]